MYYVYILTNRVHNVFYIGVTSDLEGRMYEHREHLLEGFTKRYRVTKLVFYEDYPDPVAAITREKQLKGWRREKKVRLIESQNSRWLDLFESLLGAEENIVMLRKPA
jgi:putative endonuclease